MKILFFYDTCRSINDEKFLKKFRKSLDQFDYMIYQFHILRYIFNVSFIFISCVEICMEYGVVGNDSQAMP